jgi:hypothetical protein
MALIGQFRVRGKDDRFVWLRGFKDMQSRAAANATMIDSDNVLLLRPAHADSGFSVSKPFPSGSDAPSRRAYVAGVHSLREPPREDDLARVESAIAPAVNSLGVPSSRGT